MDVRLWDPGSFVESCEKICAASSAGAGLLIPPPGTPYYITVQYITVHYITVYITLHYITAYKVDRKYPTLLITTWYNINSVRYLLFKVLVLVLSILYITKFY